MCSARDPGNQNRDDSAGPGPVLALVRYGLPAAIALAGIVLALAGGATLDAAGAVLVGVAALVALLNVLMRLGLESNGDRLREERAREYFDRHGRWPARGQ
jgi:hypothetical protein